MNKSSTQTVQTQRGGIASRNQRGDSANLPTEEKEDKTAEYLSQLLHQVKQLTDTVQQQAQRSTERQRSSRTFLRKMATEVPPVVLAVLLAFGINSWWQQRTAQQLAAQSLDNIIAETQANIVLYERVIQLDRRNLNRLNQQINDVKAGIIHLDTLYGEGRGYGQGLNTFIMLEGAWQAATLTGGIQHFDPNLVQDASEMYSKIHFRNVEHAGFRFNSHLSYKEETLLAYLLENQDVLTDHISNCQSDMLVIREFLKKYDDTSEPVK